MVDQPKQIITKQQQIKNKNDTTDDKPKPELHIEYDSSHFVCFVGNLHKDITEPEIWKIFMNRGLKPLAVRLIVSRKSRRRSYCYVDFMTSEDMDTALSWKQDATFECKGRIINIDRANPATAEQVAKYNELERNHNITPPLGTNLHDLEMMKVKDSCNPAVGAALQQRILNQDLEAAAAKQDNLFFLPCETNAAVPDPGSIGFHLHQQNILKQQVLKQQAQKENPLVTPLANAADFNGGLALAMQLQRRQYVAQKMLLEQQMLSLHLRQRMKQALHRSLLQHRPPVLPPNPLLLPLNDPAPFAARMNLPMANNGPSLNPLGLPHFNLNLGSC